MIQSVIFFASLCAFSSGAASLPFNAALQEAAREMRSRDRFAFLAQLNEQDEAVFRSAVLSEARPNLEALRALPFPKLAIVSHGLVGALGEAYLNAYARQWVRDHSGTEFIPERLLARRPPHQPETPDGLIVRRQGRRLYLVKILESRMRGQRFRPSKMQGALRGWQKDGVELPDGTVYLANRIYFESGERLDQLILSNPPHYQAAEKSVAIFLSHPRQQDGFRGTLFQTPFDGLDLTELAIRTLVLTYTGLPHIPREIDDRIGSAIRCKCPTANYSHWTFKLTQEIASLLDAAPARCEGLVIGIASPERTSLAEE